jgi:hypothetical protein
VDIDDCGYEHSQQRLAYDAMMPSSLYDAAVEAFPCPKCRVCLGTGRFTYCAPPFSTSHICITCECEQRTYVILPPMRKKRMYLDQSLISDLFLASGTKNEEHQRLLSKIMDAKRDQRVCVVISTIHLLETIAIPEEFEAKRAAIWRFANFLADGHIAEDFNAAFVADLRAVADRERDRATRSGHDCFTNKALDRWDIHPPAQRDNGWQLDGDASWRESRQQNNKRFRDVLLAQELNADRCQSSKACIDFVVGITAQEILDAIAYCRRVVLVMKALNDPDRELSCLVAAQVQSEFCLSNSYVKLIAEAFGTGETSLVKLETLEYQIKSNGLSALPSSRLTATIEGELLWTWKRGHRRNSGKFDVNFGVSRNMDIAHVSVFAPVVDVLTTDHDMYKHCQRASIKVLLSTYRCQLFSSKSYTKFETWLDSVIAETESEEFRLTRRLLYGRSSAEEDEKWNSDVAEIIEQISKARNTRL